MYNFFIENIKKYEDNILKNDYKNLECQEEFEKKLKDCSQKQVLRAINFFYKFIKSGLLRFKENNGTTVREYTTIPTATMLANIIEIYGL